MGKDLNIPFYSSIDDGGYRPREFWSHGMHRGMCSHILSQGADGIYLFNYYFGALNSEHDGKLYLEDGGQVCPDHDAGTATRVRFAGNFKRPE